MGDTILNIMREKSCGRFHGQINIICSSNSLHTNLKPVLNTVLDFGESPGAQGSQIYGRALLIA